MTIRQYVKRRVRWALMVVIACWLLISVVTQVAHGPVVTIIAGLGALAFVGAYLSVLFIRCPKCGKGIGTNIAVPVAFHLFGAEIKLCPYCGVSFDEPTERPANHREIRG
jgi:hypothetical protein